MALAIYAATKPTPRHTPYWPQFLAIIALVGFVLLAGGLVVVVALAYFERTQESESVSPRLLQPLSSPSDTPQPTDQRLAPPTSHRS
jgi:hypothetical protein